MSLRGFSPENQMKKGNKQGGMSGEMGKMIAFRKNILLL